MNARNPLVGFHAIDPEDPQQPIVYVSALYVTGIEVGPTWTGGDPERRDFPKGARILFGHGEHVEVQETVAVAYRKIEDALKTPNTGPR